MKFKKNQNRAVLIFTLGFMVACFAIVGCVSRTGNSQPPLLPELRVVELHPDFWVYDAIGHHALGTGTIDHIPEDSVLLLDTDTGEFTQLSTSGLYLLGAALTPDYAAWIVSLKKSGAPRTVADVVLYDLLTNEKRRLTDGLAKRVDLRLEDPYLVWIENQIWQEESDSSWDIYVYDLLSAKVIQLTKEPANRRNIQLSRSLLVWQEDRIEKEGQPDSGRDIYAYDLSSYREFPITTAPGVQRNPVISGDLVVWADNRHCILQSNEVGDHENCSESRLGLYAYSFASGEETQVLARLRDRWIPDFHVHDHHIVWEHWLENDRTEIRLLDFNNGLVRTVTSVRQSHTRPKIYGDYLFWTDRVACDAINLGNLWSRALAGAFVYNLDTGTKHRISNHSEPQVRVHGNVAFISEGCQYQTHSYAVFLET